MFLVRALHDEAKAFSMRYGFEVSPLDELTLLMLMKDVRMTLRDVSGG